MTPLSPETIFHLFGFGITNTFFTTIIVDIVLLSLVFLISRNIKLYPGKLQNIAEMLIEYLKDMVEMIADSRAKSIFPWFASFFIFIFFSNIMGILPGFGTIGILEGAGKPLIPVLRPATSDFNTTFALATVSLVATHVLSLKYKGIAGYLKSYFSLNPIFLFVGILEIISELTKLLSLSFRLFGNIFAGEVVLSNISSIAAYIVPIPFIALETIIAFIQAFVFATLTMVFMSILTMPHLTEH